MPRRPFSASASPARAATTIRSRSGRRRSITRWPTCSRASAMKNGDEPGDHRGLRQGVRRHQSSAAAEAASAHPARRQAHAARFTDRPPRCVSQNGSPARRIIYFRAAIVNRVWGNFMGRGIVDPVDDVRATNPASNEELFTALFQGLRRSRLRRQAPDPHHHEFGGLPALVRGQRDQLRTTTNIIRSTS